ncbi:DNA-binding transcriptional LysR family regulator [Agrobacterium larrymoorei]|uniref:DNA-binding transcriptional LysR family regulator n=1 Tax=Agrobacterium larrymoorei TaxID=160699 RepID=A0AAJ2BF11_9HYPH|nr:LysR family transcriptional regulator [Agrobacterium larrymoorei]MDR6101736.1 DNA-binding transcriptional LysR family regulator [Agrobacterium larrymoorei]
MNDIASASIESDHDGSAGYLVEQVLSSIDINLLVPLEALLATRNVSSAAHRIGQTQPAASRALARLRDILGDELLVRGASGFRLTARGEHLAEILPRAMANLRSVLSERESRATTRLTICTSLMPALLPFLLRLDGDGTKLPKVITHRSPSEGLANLRSRAADYMIGVSIDTGDEINKKIILTEDFVTLVAPQHCALNAPASPNQAFFSLTHIDVVHDGVELFPNPRRALLELASVRVEFCKCADITEAALMASEGAFALTVPRSVAGWLTKSIRLAPLSPPISIPEQEIILCHLAAVPIRAENSFVQQIGTMVRTAIAKSACSIHAFA